MANLQLVAPAPATSTYVYDVTKDYDTTNQLIITFAKGYGGATGSYKLPVGWLNEANPIQDSLVWAGFGSTTWCSNQWAPTQNVGIWTHGVNVAGTIYSLNHLTVRMPLGFQNPNSQAGFGLTHIYCRHRDVISSSNNINQSDHEAFVTRIRSVLSAPAPAVGIRRIWHNNQQQRYGLMGVVSGRLYLIVVSAANGSITTIYQATTSQGMGQFLSAEGFSNQSTLWKYSNAY